MKKMKNSKGFTLMEMLIVVAIIAILVAIAIPTFTTQLEKAREATDLANVRAAYAEVLVLALTEETTMPTADRITYTHTVTDGQHTYQAVVTLTQKVNGWATTGAANAVAGVTSAGAPTANGTATVVFTQSTGVVTITYA